MFLFLMLREDHLARVVSAQINPQWITWITEISRIGHTLKILKYLTENTFDLVTLELILSAGYSDKILFDEFNLISSATLVLSQQFQRFSSGHITYYQGSYSLSMDTFKQILHILPSTLISSCEPATHSLAWRSHCIQIPLINDENIWWYEWIKIFYDSTILWSRFPPARNSF